LFVVSKFIWLWQSYCKSSR